MIIHHIQSVWSCLIRRAAVPTPSRASKTLTEFVALVKSKPGELNYGSTGVGSANHLVTELFSSKAGLNMTHIPYRGTALAVADLLAD